MYILADGKREGEKTLFNLDRGGRIDLSQGEARWTVEHESPHGIGGDYDGEYYNQTIASGDYDTCFRVFSSIVSHTKQNGLLVSQEEEAST